MHDVAGQNSDEILRQAVLNLLVDLDRLNDWIIVVPLSEMMEEVRFWFRLGMIYSLKMVERHNLKRNYDKEYDPDRFLAKQPEKINEERRNYEQLHVDSDVPGMVEALKSNLV